MQRSFRAFCSLPGVVCWCFPVEPGMRLAYVIFNVSCVGHDCPGQQYQPPLDLLFKVGYLSSAGVFGLGYVWGPCRVWAPSVACGSKIWCKCDDSLCGGRHLVHQDNTPWIQEYLELGVLSGCVAVGLMVCCGAFSSAAVSWYILFSGVVSSCSGVAACISLGGGGSKRLGPCSWFLSRVTLVLAAP